MSSDGSNMKDYVKSTMDEIRGMSAIGQVLVGGTAGLASGYVFSRVGKMAAFTVGSSVLLLQVAQHLGYIEIRYGTKTQNRMDDLKRKALKAAEDLGIAEARKSDAAKPALERLTKDVKKFLHNNMTFAASFAGGLLIGVSV